jgi:hypothetical protein
MDPCRTGTGTGIERGDGFGMFSDNRRVLPVLVFVFVVVVVLVELELVVLVVGPVME